MALLLAGCSDPDRMLPEVHGHRGCRGLLPENTVPAFLKASDLGCDWLELDVVMTADGHVLVSHEPWMEHRICRTPSGDSIPAATEREHNIFHMSLREVQAYDCGLSRHPDFPEQQPMAAHKPTLAEMVTAVERHRAERKAAPIGYNIEIKSEPGLYGLFQPAPRPFAQAVLDVIDTLHISDRCVIQSFDPGVLEAVHTIGPDLRTALLVDNPDGLAINLARLSFTPSYYSPDKGLVDATLVEDLHERHIGLLVWTVNDAADMERLIGLGADGIITDHPDRLIALLDQH